MWNYVQVDGVWYGMDVTYDDPMGIDAALSGLENRNHFLVGSETKADGVNTFIDAHPPYKFNYPTLSKTAYDPKNSGWLEDSVGWRYRRGDGSYSENKWEQIDGTWYHFDKSGYMQTGWQKIGGVWYFFNESGAMRTGWVYDGSNWYYMSPSGAMMTGWVQDGSTWYYLKGSGAMAANEYVGGYWLNPSGSWTYQHRASWHKSGDRWWYGDTSGWYARNATYKIDGVYYGFDAEGWMK
ncbi:MAG: hypothetical protein J5928_02500 [Firmicutes bacterium]|nr:hypothetical protein [Bacillota bacterium]